MTPSDTSTPTDIPAAAKTKETLSAIAFIIRILSIIVWILSLLIICIQLLPTICIAFCCVCPVIFFYVDNKMQKKGSLITLIVIATLGFIITPWIVVYPVLLQFVDYSAWNGKSNHG